MQIKVTIEGHGTFQIERDYVNELIAFLSNKQAISIQQKNTVNEVINNQFTGRQLLEG